MSIPAARTAASVHGFDLTFWQFVRLARAKGWSTRVGLGDGYSLPDGSTAPDNSALVAAAVTIFRDG